MSAAKKKPWIRSAFSNQTISAENGVNQSTPAAKVVKRNTSFSGQLKTEELTTECEKGAPGSGAVAKNWMNNFAPATINDLAVHAKKIEELRTWLNFRAANLASICLLTGPTGAGKTAAVRVLAQEHGFQLHEWINPVDKQEVTNWDEQTSENGVFYASHVEMFKTFLRQASRYTSLVNPSNKRLLLVEDFPNSLVTNKTPFQDILEFYKECGKSPLVFIVADTKSRGLNISYNLFTDEIKTKYSIQHINFNAIASTLMQKAMTRFIILMEQRHTDIYKTPPKDVVSSIIISAQGDIRNALLNLHFASLKGAPKLLTMSVKSKPGKTARQKQSTLKSMGRDESITLLHALGRVFNPKITTERRFFHSPEEIVDAFSTEPKTFIDFVHANYLAHFKDIEHVCVGVNGISQADVVLNEYRENELMKSALNICVRSVMVANKTPATGWKPIQGKKRWTIAKPSSEELKTLGLRANISSSVFATDYKTYVKCILNQK